MKKTTSRNSRQAPPRSAALIETLRGLGYSTATALADLVDNSIAADATCVNLNFTWNGKNSVITVQDNGRGMSDSELERAMRLGELSPLESRSARDLGRFGIGLKTASFSQCRRLTVASRSTGCDVACLCWDLDVLASSKDGGWHLLEGPADESAHLIEPLALSNRGTLVIWEQMDRIVTSAFSQQDFLDSIDGIERHLSMVFHRFLSGPHALLEIRINGRPIKPWDPFMKRHPVTWTSPVDHFESGFGNVEIQGHVLPHRDRLSDREYMENSGPEGWTAQQGFYIYRNRRLLVAGSWLGLRDNRVWTKEEPYRLARIRIDIPNTVDADWKIDIRKSRASPPVELRPTLKRFAEDIRERARRVFAHRGRPTAQVHSRAVGEVWKAEQNKSGTRYRVDLNHPAIDSVIAAAGELAPDICAMLRLIETTVPVQRIWLDTAERKETPVSGFDASNQEDLRSILEIMFKNMVSKKNMTAELAKERLLSTEPFHDYPELIKALKNPKDPANKERPDEQ